MLKFKKNNRGSALLLAVLILAGILVIALLASDLVQSGIKQGRTQAESTKSYFAAETGMERVLKEVWKDQNYDFSACLEGECVDFDNSPVVCALCAETQEAVGDSYYFVKYNPDSFVSTGVYGDTRRTIEVTFGRALE